MEGQELPGAKFSPGSIRIVTNIRKRKIAACRGMLLLAAIVIFPPVVTAGQSAPGTVERLHEALLEVMGQADELGFSGRRDRLDPVIRASFDLPYISRLVLGGRRWSALDESQRSQMVATFTRLTVATYANRFDGYAGERFNILEERPLKRGRMLVRSELRDADGDAVQLDYVLHKAADRWRIVNVVANGVSDLSLKRADYAAAMKNEGFQALMVKLDDQVSGLAMDAGK